jgi:ribonuclease HII
LSNKIIDERGIGFCNQEVFRKACYGLKFKPELVLSDGYPIKNFNINNKDIVKGDSKSASIACASIVAKVFRDSIMKEYGEKFPEYGFDHNSGYGTEEHINAIKKYGVTEIHRLSFLKNIIY